MLLRIKKDMIYIFSSIIYVFISNPAFQRLPTQTEQPPKTNINMKSWALGNTGLFLQKHLEP